MLRPAGQHPLLEAVDLHGAHDFRHTYATWLEDAGIPARVIDELMGHEATSRSGQQRGRAMGAHYRHTTPEMGPARHPGADEPTTASPNRSSSSAQAAAASRSMRPMDAAVSADDRPRAMAPAAGQRMGGRDRGLPEPQPEGGQVTAGDRRRDHRQGQEPSPEVVAEAGQGALHGERAEPPTSWLASTTQTGQPASASRNAAANPLGPPPATTASKSPMAFRYPGRTQRKQSCRPW